jgi:hypothetical protein
MNTVGYFVIWNNPKTEEKVIEEIADFYEMCNRVAELNSEKLFPRVAEAHTIHEFVL